MNTTLTCILHEYNTDLYATWVQHWPVCYHWLYIALNEYNTDLYATWVQHWPVCYMSTTLTRMLHKYNTDPYATREQHWPICYMSTTLTCMLHENNTDLYAITDHNPKWIQRWPVWLQSLDSVAEGFLPQCTTDGSIKCTIQYPQQVDVEWWQDILDLC